MRYFSYDFLDGVRDFDRDPDSIMTVVAPVPGFSTIGYGGSRASGSVPSFSFVGQMFIPGQIAIRMQHPETIVKTGTRIAVNTPGFSLSGSIYVGEGLQGVVKWRPPGVVLRGAAAARSSIPRPNIVITMDADGPAIDIVMAMQRPGTVLTLTPGAVINGVFSVPKIGTILVLSQHGRYTGYVLEYIR